VDGGQNGPAPLCQLSQCCHQVHGCCTVQTYTACLVSQPSWSWVNSLEQQQMSSHLFACSAQLAQGACTVTAISAQMITHMQCRRQSCRHTCNKYSLLRLNMWLSFLQPVARQAWSSSIDLPSSTKPATKKRAIDISHIMYNTYTCTSIGARAHAQNSKRGT